MHGLLSFAVVTFYLCGDGLCIKCSNINYFVPQKPFAGVVSNHLVHCINSSFGFVIIKYNFGLAPYFFILKLVMVHCTKKNLSTKENYRFFFGT